MQSLVPFFLVLALLVVPAFPQSLVDSIFQAHGGAALLQKGQACELQGTVERDLTKLPFVLKLSGENSRLETGEQVIVRRGMTEQAWRKGGPKGDIMPVVLGTTEAYFLPFLALSQIKRGDFQSAGLKDGYYVFSRRLILKRFIGYEPDTPMLELAFNPDTRLLAELRFFTLEGNQSPVTLVCSDYFSSDGIAVPRTVEQIVEGILRQTFFIESVTLGASFSESDFSITR